MAVGHLRFVPKPKSLRPIVNLGKDTVIRCTDENGNRSTRILNGANMKLREGFQILNKEVVEKISFPFNSFFFEVGCMHLWGKRRKTMIFGKERNMVRKLYRV